MNENKLDILFIHPPDYWFSINAWVPMGLIALMNKLNCRKKGVMYYEINSNLIKNTKIIAMDLHWYFTLYGVDKISKMIKKINPECKIIVGGYTATSLSDAVIGKLDVDFVVRGDAEVSFPMLVERLLEGGDITTIPNITSKEFSTPLSYTLTEEDYNNSNYLEFNWFDKFKEEVYKQQKSRDFLITYPFVPVYRGCIYNCEFCYGNTNLQKKLCGREKIVMRSPEIIKNDLLYWSKDENIKTVFMVNDFLDAFPENLLPEYIEKIFSIKYNLNISYDFYNIPSKEIFETFLKCFNKCFFALPTEKRHAEKKELQDFKQISETIKFLENKNCNVVLFIDSHLVYKFKNYYYEVIKVYKEFPKTQGGGSIFDNGEWTRPIPYPTENKDKQIFEFEKFKKKSKYILFFEMFKAHTIGRFLFLQLVTLSIYQRIVLKIHYFLSRFNKKVR